MIPTFREVEGKPVQVSAPPARVFVPLVDLTALPDAEAAARELRVFSARSQESAWPTSSSRLS